MSDALEQASLIMVPSGYENGTLGSLKPLDGTGDFTFSRGSDISATRVNEQGYIEKGYENLLLQSNSFTTSPWATSGLDTPIGGQEGYDGSNDAWNIVPNASSVHYLLPNASPTGVFTFSFYAKANGYNGILIYNPGAPAAGKYFDLVNGVMNGYSGSPVDSTMTDVGNGWYRCSFTNSKSTGSISIYISDNGTDNISFVGDGIKGVLFQDAMLNQGLVAYPYVETTTAPVAGGILEDMPRLDYSNGSCPSLLLEPSRTNLFTYSEYFGSGSDWSKVQTSVSTNQIISPSGKTSASKIIEDNLNTNFQLSRSLSVTSGVSYTISIFAKSTERYLQIKSSTGFPFSYANFDLINGVLGTDGGSLTPSINSYGNGWYRCSVTFTATSTTNGLFVFHIVNSANASRGQSYQGDGTSGIYIYGAQLEQDATYPTSYIPTYGTSQTRLIDSAFISSANGVVGLTEGTIFIDYHIDNYGNNGNILYSISDGTTSNLFYLWHRKTNAISFDGRSSGSRIDLDSATNYPVGTHKVAIVYKENDCAMFIDGEKVVTDTSAQIPVNLTEIQLEYFLSTETYLNQKTNQFTLFPTALSDDECIALTTIS